MPAATPPAAVTPGDLYVDLQSRALWLGVDTAIVPAGVVLISDVVYTFEQIAAAIVTANAYTDAQIATRAPLVHTHTSAAITDFSAAVLAVIAANPAAQIPPGLIAIWKGPVSDIGVGILSTWALCDGTNGTPDLRDKFVMGAGNVAAGSTNPAAIATTSADGAHTPIVQSTTLTASQIPAHVHTVNLTGNDTAVSTVAGGHSHAITGQILLNSGGATGFAAGANGIDFSPTTGVVAGHSHSVTVSVNINGNTGSIGSGASHTHLVNAVPAHTHTITSADLRAALPYVAQAYIMKL